MPKATERDPEQAEITVARPVDFDAFWARTSALTDAVAPRAVLVDRPDRSSDEVTVQELYYSGFGDVRVAAWCARPARAAGPLPVAMHIPGYISEPAILKSWARRGYFVADLAPRGKLRANARFNPGYPGMLVENILDRNTYGYRGFYMDIVRGIDVLRALPGVDGGRFGVFGSSQGGGLGIVAAALRPDVVRCVAAGCPYLCGIRESARLTHSYPYEEINEYLRAHPEHAAAVEETLAYYDVLHFAEAVRAPVLLHLGMADDVCPPETGFAAYRALNCPKRLRAYPGCGHDAGARWVTPEVEAFMDEHIGVGG